jgi:hypothetical protein
MSLFKIIRKVLFKSESWIAVISRVLQTSIPVTLAIPRIVSSPVTQILDKPKPEGRFKIGKA